MVIRLPDLVGSPLSLNALREDLQVSHQSVSRWISMLENLYMIFRIYPFGAPKIRAVKKEAKHYHLDWTVISDMGLRFENLVACHLLKWCFFLSGHRKGVISNCAISEMSISERSILSLSKTESRFSSSNAKPQKKRPALPYGILKSDFHP